MFEFFITIVKLESLMVVVPPEVEEPFLEAIHIDMGIHVNTVYYVIYQRSLFCEY